MRAIRLGLAMAFFGWGTAALAGDPLHVPDASSLRYMAGPDNRVYFRNLNTIDSTCQGCCTFYWIDLSTDAGKAQFSAFLSAKYAHAPIDFWIDSKAGGVFLQVGAA